VLKASRSSVSGPTFIRAFLLGYPAESSTVRTRPRRVWGEVECLFVPEKKDGNKADYDGDPYK